MRDSEEDVKRRLMFGLIAFNVIVVLGMIGFVVLRGGMGGLGFGDFVLTILAGLVVGGATFGAATAMKL